MLTALFSVATILDDRHQYLELFSHFRLQYFVAAVLLAIVLGLARRWRMALLMLLASLLNVSYVLPWHAGNVAVAGATGLTLLHSNILYSNEDVSELLGAIEREMPHIVVVQELTTVHADALTALSDSYPHQVVQPGIGAAGIGVYSSLPFMASELIETPPLGLPSIIVEVEYDGAALTVLTSHPVPPIGNSAYASRNAQLAYLASRAAVIEGSVVLIGDLNISMWAAHYRALKRDSKLVNARHGHGVLPTWPTFLPIAMIPIDHALISTDLVAPSVRTLSSVGSDHLPLLVEIARRDATSYRKVVPQSADAR